MTKKLFTLLLCLFLALSALSACSARRDDQIKEDYAQFLDQQYGGAQDQATKVQDVRVLQDFGTYHGCRVVFMDANLAVSLLILEMDIAGYTFKFGDSRPMYVYRAHEFLEIAEAYEAGWITKSDVGKVCEKFNKTA